MQKHQRAQSSVWSWDCNFEIETHTCARAQLLWSHGSPVIQYAVRWKNRNGDNDLRDSELLLVATWLIVWPRWGWSGSATPLASSFTGVWGSPVRAPAVVLFNGKMTRSNQSGISTCSTCSLWCVAPLGSWRMKWSSLVLQVFQLSPWGLESEQRPRAWTTSKHLRLSRGRRSRKMNTRSAEGPINIRLHRRQPSKLLSSLAAASRCRYVPSDVTSNGKAEIPLHPQRVSAGHISTYWKLAMLGLLLAMTT